MIIDVHCHVGKGEFLNDIFQIENKLSTVLEHQKIAGVDRTVIFPVRYKHYRKANIEIAELCKQYPSNFIGFGRVSAGAEDVAQELDFAINELGLKGIKIHTMDGFPSKAAMDKIDQLGVPVLFHSGMGLAPSKFEAIAKTYPNMTMILAHLGTELGWENMIEYPEQAMRMAAEYENVYVDTSAVYLQYVLERAVKVCGPKKMLFGSDGTWFHPAISIRQIELLDIDEADKRAILGGNAAKILGL